MPRTLLLALLLLVATPLVSLAWLSANAAKSGERTARQRLIGLLDGQLKAADERISSVFAGYASDLDQNLTQLSSSVADRRGLSETEVVEALKAMRWQSPLLRQGFYIDPEGNLLYPTVEDLSQIDSSEVLVSIPGIIDSRPSLTPKDEGQQETVSDRQSARLNEQQRSSRFQTVAVDTTRSLAFGSRWQQWYLADGSQVIYWIGRRDGSSIGVLLERGRWMADVIAELPDDAGATSASFGGLPLGSVSLLDESNRSIFRWGNLKGSNLERLHERNVSLPLASWRLTLDIDPTLIPKASLLPIYASLAGVATVVLGIGFFVLTSVRRQISDAKRRVNFAGQVSHELRTPLTNIRLYTELAEKDVAKLTHEMETGPLRKRLQVIDHESRRLQRLVSGVLEMIRPSGKPAKPRCIDVSLCELLQGLAEQFQPSFEAAQLSLELDCQVVGKVLVDPDIVELVIVNLLGNVEKYAGRRDPNLRGRCRVLATKREETVDKATIRILVEDDGPGIDRKDHGRVFRPFIRLDDSIQAPSGTGIGLTIARRAARRHGGDLTLLRHSELGGAAFEFTIVAEPVQSRETNA
ncbi:MAG: HAMP domain-containing sensor histidine kinase [Planctomycetota bacterium]